MRCLNEPIARQANQEDGCKGHFFESRFTSQALLTEEALISCMAYVDLNPVRAKMASKPEQSDFTSFKERIKPCFDPIKAIEEQIKQGYVQKFDLPIKPLLKFEGTMNWDSGFGIPFDFEEYLNLVDWTGRAIREDKRGFIPQSLPRILNRLKIEDEDWLLNSTLFEQNYNGQFHKRRIRQKQKLAA